MTYKLPQEDSDGEIFKSLYAQSEEFLQTSNASIDGRGSARVSDLYYDGWDSGWQSASNTKEIEPQVPSTKNDFKSHESSTQLLLMNFIRKQWSEEKIKFSFTLSWLSKTFSQEYLYMCTGLIRKGKQR